MISNIGDKIIELHSQIEELKKGPTLEVVVAAKQRAIDLEGEVGRLKSELKDVVQQHGKLWGEARAATSRDSTLAKGVLQVGSLDGGRTVGPIGGPGGSSSEGEESQGGFCQGNPSNSREEQEGDRRVQGVARLPA